MERKFVLESGLASGRWGLLELCILLTNDVVEFDGGRRKYDYLETFREKLSPAIDIKLHYRKHFDLFLTLLRIKCTISSSISSRTSSN